MPTEKTSISRRWLMKMFIFLIVLVGIGIWGVVDASLIYPRRGERDASLRLRNYLQAASECGRLYASDIKVEQPDAELATLRTKEPELARQAAERSPDGSFPLSARYAAFELARLEYLRAMDRVWKLSQAQPRLAAITDPAAELARLNQEWSQQKPPKPLSELDLHIQWLIALIGFVLALWVLFIMLRVAATRFTYDTDRKALTTPDGTTFSPADIKELDKRRWHKFFVTVHLKSGKSRTLDLLRYVPLESWILDMERTAFPDTDPAPDAASTLENAPDAPASPDNAPGN